MVSWFSYCFLCIHTSLYSKKRILQDLIPDFSEKKDKLLNLIKIKMTRCKKMLNLHKDVDIIYRTSCSKKQKVRKQIKGILEKDARETVGRGLKLC